jgi:Tol biopolymer transport system component
MAGPFNPRMHARLAAILAALVLAVLLTYSAASAATYDEFGAPQPVLIEGYDGSAMEPFISSDGQQLLFNTSNAPPGVPSLQLASHVAGQDFDYQGELPGEAVNEPGDLSGTPSMDVDGELFFVSNRSYEQTLSTVYSGVLSGGSVTGVHLVRGVSAARPGLVDFDASISSDGEALYVSIGDFSSGTGPTSATIALFDRSADGFTVDPIGAKLLKAVNKPRTLDYAACVSSDGLEIFFTRAKPPKSEPAIYRAYRRKLGKPFGHVQRVSAISGFSEAPSLTADGRTLYYHHLSNGQFEIETVTRP